MTTPHNSDGRPGRHSQPQPTSTPGPYQPYAAPAPRYGQAPQYGHADQYDQYGRPQYDRADQYGQAEQYGRAQYGRADEYGRAPWTGPAAQATPVPRAAAQGGPAGYGQPPYGPPSGGGYPSYGPPSVPTQRPPADGGVRPVAPARLPRNGFGTTALVLGIIGLLFAFIPVIGVIAWPLVILGLIFGGLGIARARSGAATNQGVAISGTVLSAIGLIVCIVWVAAFSSAVSTVPAAPVAPATGGTVSASGGGGQPAPGPTFPGTTSNDVTGTAGDTLTVGDMQVTATALKPGDSVLGNRTLCSTVTYRNTGSTPANFNPIDWKLQDPAGAALTTGFMGSNTLLQFGDLAPGGTAGGDICFNRTTGAGQYVLLYDPMDFSSTRAAWLNQLG